MDHHRKQIIHIYTLHSRQEKYTPTHLHTSHTHQFITDNSFPISPFPRPFSMSTQSTHHLFLLPTHISHCLGDLILFLLGPAHLVGGLHHHRGCTSRVTVTTQVATGSQSVDTQIVCTCTIGDEQAQMLVNTQNKRSYYINTFLFQCTRW